jgi:hypothetical protein
MLNEKINANFAADLISIRSRSPMLSRKGPENQKRRGSNEGIKDTLIYGFSESGQANEGDISYEALLDQ